MLKDRPISPNQELIQSVEYSAKHPQLFDVLQLESAEMGFIEYYCLDILLCILLASIAAFSVLFYLTKRLGRLFFYTGKIKSS